MTKIKIEQKAKQKRKKLRKEKKRKKKTIKLDILLCIANAMCMYQSKVQSICTLVTSDSYV